MPHTHKDVANIDMTARMIRAAGRRAGGYDPDQLPRLSHLHAEVEAAMVAAVAGMREQGVTWASIGNALGITKQAALMFYGPRVAELVGAVS